jgi:thymidine phosphorylase
MPLAHVTLKKENKMSNFAAPELIIAKREKGELSTEAIYWLIENYTSGDVADEQMSAMAMAILLNGMNRREIKDLTMAMIASGERLNYDDLAWPTSDSTRPAEWATKSPCR